MRIKLLALDLRGWRRWAGRDLVATYFLPNLPATMNMSMTDISRLSVKHCPTQSMILSFIITLNLHV